MIGTAPTEGPQSPVRHLNASLLVLFDISAAVPDPDPPIPASVAACELAVPDSVYYPNEEVLDAHRRPVARDRIDHRWLCC